MNNKTKSILYGTLASSILLGVYFTVLTLVSGWSFTQEQFVDYWYFVVSGVTGLATFAAQYQVKLFWVGIFFNIAGIVYMINRIIKFKKEYKPIAWEGPVGGHHREDMLIFNQITPNPKSVELKISNIGDVVRSFVWQF